MCFSLIFCPSHHVSCLPILSKLGIKENLIHTTMKALQADLAHPITGRSRTSFRHKSSHLDPIYIELSGAFLSNQLDTESTDVLFLCVNSFYNNLQ